MRRDNMNGQWAGDSRVTQRDLEHPFVSRGRDIVHWWVNNLTKKMGHKRLETSMQDLADPVWAHLVASNISELHGSSLAHPAWDLRVVGGHEEVESRRSIGTKLVSNWEQINGCDRGIWEMGPNWAGNGSQKDMQHLGSQVECSVGCENKSRWLLSWQTEKKMCQKVDLEEAIIWTDRCTDKAVNDWCAGDTSWREIGSRR